MSTSVRFLKAQAGRQSVFGTSVAPTFQLPFTGEYQDAQEEHSAEYDAGTWTETEIVEKTAGYATFNLNGVMFFELLPVFLSAGFDALTPSAGPPYSYDGSVSPAAVGAPVPYTFRFGGNEALGGTGPAIQIQDAYMQQMVLSSDFNSKQVSVQSNWWGLEVDDNSAAGYAFAAVNLVPSLGMMKVPLGLLDIDDAAPTTGGVFTTMTAFECALLAWTLTINTGAMPKWALDGNQLTVCGVRFGMPSVTFQATIRTNATNYALVKAKADARTFQELQHTLNGADSRQVVWQMTGRWLPNFTAHTRSNDEVVMAPTFKVSTPWYHTTTPHWFGWQLDTAWDHP